MSDLTFCTYDRRFLNAACTLAGAVWITASAFCTLAWSVVNALSRACLAAAKLPDAIAFPSEEPTELDPVCSLFTVRHIAAVGFEPLTWLEWCFFCDADAALIGARVRATPIIPTQMTCHIRLCFTIATSTGSNCGNDATAPVAVTRGTWGCVRPGPGAAGATSPTAVA